MTQFEAFQKVYDMIALLYSKGLGYVDSLEWRPDENKFVYWGNCYPLVKEEQPSPDGFHYKTPFFDAKELKSKDLNDDRCSQVLIMKKYEVLAYIITSKAFTNYVTNQMLTNLEDNFIKDTPLHGK